MSEHADGHAAAGLRRNASAQVFVDPEQLDGNVLEVGADDEHHLRRVLRLRDGETVCVSDGVGRWCLAAVGDGGAGRASAGTFVLEPTSEVFFDEVTHAPLTIASAIPKGDRLDWMVQKATELGVDRLQLLHSERSVVRWKDSRVAHQLARLSRISDEAARQSRRVWRVEIIPPLDAIDVLPSAVIAEPGGRAIDHADSVIAVGPEGGWSREELSRSSGHVNLGPNILRTETATVAAITLSVAARH